MSGPEDIRYNVLSERWAATSRNLIERLVQWRVFNLAVGQRYKASEQPLARKPAR